MCPVGSVGSVPACVPALVDLTDVAERAVAKRLCINAAECSVEKLSGVADSAAISDRVRSERAAESGDVGEFLHRALCCIDAQPHTKALQVIFDIRRSCAQWTR